MGPLTQCWLKSINWQTGKMNVTEGSYNFLIVMYMLLWNQQNL